MGPQGHAGLCKGHQISQGRWPVCPAHEARDFVNTSICARATVNNCELGNTTYTAPQGWYQFMTQKEIIVGMSHAPAIPLTAVVVPYISRGKDAWSGICKDLDASILKVDAEDRISINKSNYSSKSVLAQQSERPQIHLRISSKRLTSSLT